ncbi:hypothetical protein [Schleiferilactobacillus shenzhenensis]|nr:hypothetical protein [Schleiferilactobacillus shenzhenensis]
MASLSVSAGFFVLPRDLPRTTAAHFLTLVGTYLAGTDYPTWLHPNTGLELGGDWQIAEEHFTRQLQHSAIISFDGVGINSFTHNIVATLDWLQEGVETTMPDRKPEARSFLQEVAMGLAAAGPVMYRYTDVVEPRQTYYSLEMWQVSHFEKKTEDLAAWNQQHRGQHQLVTIIAGIPYLSRVVPWDEAILLP